LAIAIVTVVDAVAPDAFEIGTERVVDADGQ
jgi:hypothetical protein